MQVQQGRARSAATQHSTVTVAAFRDAFCLSAEYWRSRGRETKRHGGGRLEDGRPAALAMPASAPGLGCSGGCGCNCKEKQQKASGSAEFVWSIVR